MKSQKEIQALLESLQQKDQKFNGFTDDWQENKETTDKIDILLWVLKDEPPPPRPTPFLCPICNSDIYRITSYLGQDCETVDEMYGETIDLFESEWITVHEQTFKCESYKCNWSDTPLWRAWYEEANKIAIGQEGPSKVIPYREWAQQNSHAKNESPGDIRDSQEG